MAVSKSVFLKDAKEAAQRNAWPETQFIAGAKWAFNYLAEPK